MYPQDRTERLLLAALERVGGGVERPVEMVRFHAMAAASPRRSTSMERRRSSTANGSSAATACTAGCGTWRLRSNSALTAARITPARQPGRHEERAFRKSPTLKSLMGVVTPRTCSVVLDHVELGLKKSHVIARRQLVHEERRVFGSLDVEENLLLAGLTALSKWPLGHIYEMFPRLKERAAAAVPTSRETLRLCRLVTAECVSRERRLETVPARNSTAGLFGADGIFVAAPPSR